MPERVRSGGDRSSGPLAPPPWSEGASREIALLRLMSTAAADAFSALLLAFLIVLAAWLLLRWTPQRYSLKAWLGIGLL
jgi:hypothetical protein